MPQFEPRYLQSHRSSRLSAKAELAESEMDNCCLCPRKCGVNRNSGETGVCKTGRLAVVSSFNAHFGEEDPLVGKHGSGTIFFAHCNLLCNFCQNYEISHLGEGSKITNEQLAYIMLELQRAGCHNINLVTPTHVTAQILGALCIAADNGLQIPVVYNSGGYDSVETLKLLEGAVDIYMPDFKFWDPQVAEQTCSAPDYPEIAQAALLEMHRQVGDLAIESDGLASSGLLVRHLVLPGGMAGTKEVMTFIANRVSPRTYVNIMPQYRPCGKAAEIPALAGPLTGTEFQTAVQEAKNAGIKRFDRRRPKFAIG
jgi:putative pyruvate formate lyase activating enzyme